MGGAVENSDSRETGGLFRVRFDVICLQVIEAAGDNMIRRDVEILFATGDVSSYKKYSLERS